jgi:hypothetical protein
MGTAHRFVLCYVKLKAAPLRKANGP